MLTVLSGVGPGVMPEASRVCASHLPVRQGQQARTGCIATDWLQSYRLGCESTDWLLNNGLVSKQWTINVVMKTNITNLKDVNCTDVCH